MQAYDSSLAQQFGELLDQHEARLRALLQGGREADAARASAHEVSDQKDAAARAADVLVQQTQQDHAAQELRLVQAARQRLAFNEYGHCLRCGAAIDVRRLAAMPAAPCCAPCQALQESATGAAAAQR